MNKHGFLMELKKHLSGLPEEDIQSSLDYYGEIIEDRMEEGLREEEAVAAVGEPAEVAAQILAEIPLGKLVKAKLKPRRTIRPWEILLLVLGAPLWFPLLAAVLAVLAAIYLAIWAVVLSFYAADLALAILAVAGLAAAAMDTANGHPAAGACLLGAGLVLAGLAILLFLGCNQMAKGTLWLGKTFLYEIRFCFIRREAVQ